MSVKRCPITYEPIAKSKGYSESGLRSLSRNLKELKPLPFSADDLLIEAAKQATKMSIQGFQPKLSAKLNAIQGYFEIVDRNGHFILKPPTRQYIQVPENEDVTMRMAAVVGLEVPLHGLLYNNDATFTYFIKRFDRFSKIKKRQIEDFAQLTNHVRDVKYKSSMEQVVEVINKFCTFPMVEKQKMLLLTLFNFVVGNEDMHLKNFSLITIDNKVMLSPAYDLLNTTIILGNAKEELALPLSGKKSNLRKEDFLQYFAVERMLLNEMIIDRTLQKITKSVPTWLSLIKQSFLSEEMKEKYREVLRQRLDRLHIPMSHQAT